MNLPAKTFGDFDFSCTEDPEFKEDSVREDIIAPLLRKVGWSANGPHRIIRSRPLVHPYVMFGSQKRKLNIIPDYLLELDGKPCFVLDAKSPHEEITRGDNVAQVYSYAIHPEVRAWNYGLCNGKSLALFEITSINPKRVYDFTHLTDADLLDINQKLNPRTISENAILGYLLDGGTYLHIVMDMPPHMEITFTSVPLSMIGVVAEGQYSMNVVCTNMTDHELMFTYDFNKEVLDSLLSQLPPAISTEIAHSLSSYPFQYRNNVKPPLAHITCKQATEPTFSRKGEMFFPLQVIGFSTKGILNAA